MANCTFLSAKWAYIKVVIDVSTDAAAQTSQINGIRSTKWVSNSALLPTTNHPVAVRLWRMQTS